MIGNRQFEKKVENFLRDGIVSDFSKEDLKILTKVKTQQEAARKKDRKQKPNFDLIIGILVEWVVFLIHDKKTVEFMKNELLKMEVILIEYVFNMPRRNKFIEDKNLYFSNNPKYIVKDINLKQSRSEFNKHAFENGWDLPKYNNIYRNIEKLDDIFEAKNLGNIAIIPLEIEYQYEKYLVLRSLSTTLTTQVKLKTLVL